MVHDVVLRVSWNKSTSKPFENLLEMISLKEKYEYSIFSFAFLQMG